MKELKVQNKLDTTISKGSLSLMPIRDKDFPLLYEWRNSEAFLNFLTSEPLCETYESFVLELSHCLAYDRYSQYIIHYKTEPIGTIYSYQYDNKDKYIFVSIYIHNNIEFIGKGAMAMILYCKHLFDKLNLFKIYFDVYEYNLNTIKLLDKRISREGVFKNQHIKDGKRYDVVRYAIYDHQL